MRAGEAACPAPLGGTPPRPLPTTPPHNGAPGPAHARTHARPLPSPPSAAAAASGPGCSAPRPSRRCPAARPPPGAAARTGQMRACRARRARGRRTAHTRPAARCSRPSAACAAGWCHCWCPAAQRSEEKGRREGGVSADWSAGQAGGSTGPHTRTAGQQGLRGRAGQGRGPAAAHGADLRRLHELQRALLLRGEVAAGGGGAAGRAALLRLGAKVAGGARAGAQRLGKHHLRAGERRRAPCRRASQAGRPGRQLLSSGPLLPGPLLLAPQQSTPLLAVFAPMHGSLHTTAPLHPASLACSPPATATSAGAARPP